MFMHLPWSLLQAMLMLLLKCQMSEINKANHGASPCGFLAFLVSCNCSFPVCCGGSVTHICTLVVHQVKMAKKELIFFLLCLFLLAGLIILFITIGSSGDGMLFFKLLPYSLCLLMQMWACLYILCVCYLDNNLFLPYILGESLVYC